MLLQVFTLKTTVFELSTDLTGVKLVLKRAVVDDVFR